MSAPQYGQQPYSPREGIAITTQYSVLAWRGRLRWTGGRPVLRHGDDRHGQVRRQCQRLRGHPDAVSTSRVWIAAAALSLVGWVAVLPAGVAHAGCTSPGDFGAGAGCPPPGSSSGSGNTESWPPTSVDWPPQLNPDSGSDSGGDSGANGGGGAKPTPIVMPSGQKPPPATPSSGSDSTSTSTPPKPIVPVGSASTATTPSTSSTPTPIVTPQG